MKIKAFYMVLAIVCGLAFSQQAKADTMLLRTGVNGAGTPLGQNVADPFWTISVQGGGFASAEVVNSDVICCGMESVGATARWISDSSVTAGSTATGWGVGPTAIARRTFDVTGFDLTTLSLTGNWRVADNRLGVFLNGNLLAGTNTGAFGFQSDQAFSAGSGLFVSGINTLELRGNSVNSVFDGFWMDATVEGVRGTAVPEPSSLTLLLVGVGLASARARRNR